MARHRRLYTTEQCDPPYEWVPVASRADHPIPASFRRRILIHTVHDGDRIPKSFLYDDKGKPLIPREELDAAFIVQRDWGANLVAHKMASAMGVEGYARCRIARVLMDFNRFPGSTPGRHRAGPTRPLETLAINPPFSAVLNHEQKVRLLEEYYDRMSEKFDGELLHDRLIIIAVHTYDEHNPTRTRRPHLSLLTSMAGYQRESRMPFGIFDPIYPDGLGESTCSRILRDRISLNLERTGFRVSHNHPYPLPEGSMEVRGQVWYFFDFLRQRFQKAFPETREDASYKLVWLMLLNTNLRLQEGEMLRSYLHRFRRVTRGQKEKLRKARVAYEHVSNFLLEKDVEMEFRRSVDRPSCIGLEVRKDLLCTFDDDGRPLPLTREQEAKAALIGNVVANAITTYFETDIHFL